LVSFATRPPLRAENRCPAAEEPLLALDHLDQIGDRLLLRRDASFDQSCALLGWSLENQDGPLASRKIEPTALAPIVELTGQLRPVDLTQPKRATE
jgi:hypothetical protein